MAYLTKQQVRDIIAKAPPGTSPEGIVAALRESHQLEGYGGAPETGKLIQTPSLPRRLANRVAGAAPAIGGLAGGLVGTPLGLPGMVQGAAIGGVIGKGAQQVYTGQPIDPLAMAHSGVEQGAYELGGNVIAAGARAVARPIMGHALSASKAELIGRAENKAAGAAKWNQLIEDAIAKRTPVGVGGILSGASMRDKSALALKKLLGRAEKEGFNAAPGDVTAAARKLSSAERLMLKENKAAARSVANFQEKYAEKKLPDQVSTILDQYGKPAVVKPGETIPARNIKPQDLKDIKQRFQNMSKRSIKANKGGTAGQLFKEEMAAGAQKELEKISGVKEREAYTQRMILLTNALSKAMSSQPAPIEQLVTTGIGGAAGFGAHGFEGLAGGALLARLLTSKAAQSRAALLLTDPKFATIARQSPRFFVELVNQSTFQDTPPDATSGQ